MNNREATMGKPAGAGSVRTGSLSKIIKIAVLSAMAFILMFFEFPLPIFPDFLKIDVSDLPAFLGAFAIGPMAGVAIELMKNLLHLIIKGTTSVGVGELANFIVGSALVVPAAMIYRRNKSKNSAAVGILVGILSMGVVASIFNYFVLLPMYEKALHFPISAIVEITSKVNSAVKDLNTLVIYSILPFNLLKGAVVGVITFLSYKRLSGILHK